MFALGKNYDVRQITRYISKSVQDRHMNTNRKSYALYRMATLLMTLSDPTHPKSSLLLRFGSSLEWLKLQSSSFIHR